MGVATLAEVKPSVAGKRLLRPSSSARHAADWPISDVSSDLTIEVGSSTFSLHKFPLVSRCGRFRKLLMDTKDSNSRTPKISIPHFPGGPPAFEAAAKFCYGITAEITLLNAAALRCAAHFLEMTEDYAQNNLAATTEAYINHNILPHIPKSVTLLHQCESLMPLAEEIGLVGRIVTAIANNAAKRQLESKFSEKVEEMEADWWGDSMVVLCLEFFRRVVMALKVKGLKQELISRILVNYTHGSLQGVVGKIDGVVKCMDLESQKKQRVMVEAIVSLLPTASRKSCVPMAFLSGLLKCSVASSASLSCREDLERRIGMQLDQAALEDILIPANLHGNSRNPLYDTDVTMRIFAVFINLDVDDDEEEEDRFGDETDANGSYSPRESAIVKVSGLLDSYLAEVALDSNLGTSRFIALAELLSDHARNVTDGLYRAVDIFLKVHPNIKEAERHRLCKTIDCRKLSQEACSHAAQNERLPVQMAVQVLFFEQTRLKTAITTNHNHLFFSQFPHRSSSNAGGSGAISPRDNYASVRRENRELKLEVTRMRMRLTHLEKDHVSMKQEFVRPNTANRLLRSFSRRMGKLNAFFRRRGSKAGSESRFFSQNRSYSVS